MSRHENPEARVKAAGGFGFSAGGALILTVYISQRS